MLAFDLLSRVVVFIISAQTVKFEDFEWPKPSYFCVLPEICSDWVLP